MGLCGVVLNFTESVCKISFDVSIFNSEMFKEKWSCSFEGLLLIIVQDLNKLRVTKKIGRQELRLRLSSRFKTKVFLTTKTIGSQN